MRCCMVTLLFLTMALCRGQNAPTQNLHHGLAERIGNFSVEFLYHAAKAQARATNLVLSPFTIWTVLAVSSEGAIGNTRKQINNLIRVTKNNPDQIRDEYKSIAQWLKVKTDAVEVAKINVIFIDENFLLLQDFKEAAKSEYDTDVIALDFKRSEATARIINKVISNVTQGRISKFVDSSYFYDSRMFLTSAVYFKGKWTLPFNSLLTEKLPFFDNDGKKIGEVNMMYNRHPYFYANIYELNAKVLELPYGTENRLSLIILLPNPGVSVEDMFLNFNEFTIDKLFRGMRINHNHNGDKEVHCFIPRFKIESNLDLTQILRDRLGVEDFFHPSKARLYNIARSNLYASKFIHKAEIEVTEEGTTDSEVVMPNAKVVNDGIRFEANRPFSYMIIEKITNSIVFGGIYQEPELF